MPRYGMRACRSLSAYYLFGSVLASGLGSPYFLRSIVVTVSSPEMPCTVCKYESVSLLFFLFFLSVVTLSVPFVLFLAGSRVFVRDALCMRA
ncbi:hypothetical protein B0H19DRAFT_396622 [Mycena capillaripes]|nr:hypothetical protein B0H19DRAFT_396622 [Mycena capillaripes]